MAASSVSLVSSLQQTVMRWKEKHETYLRRASRLQKLSKDASLLKVSKTYQSFLGAYQDLKCDLTSERWTRHSRDPVLARAIERLDALKNFHRETKKSIAHLPVFYSHLSKEALITKCKTLWMDYKIKYPVSTASASDVYESMRGYHALKTHLKVLSHALKPSDARQLALSQFNRNVHELNRRALVGNSSQGAADSKRRPFEPFSVKIGYNSIKLNSKKEMRLKVRELGKHVLDRHAMVHFRFQGFSESQFAIFVKELQTVADVLPVNSGDETHYSIQPKSTEEIKEKLRIRRYKNGIVEEVRTESTSGGPWWGRRLHPNGVIEEGKFFRVMALSQGVRQDSEGRTYVGLQEPYFQTLGRAIMGVKENGQRRLIVVESKENNAFEYLQVDADPILAFIEILKAGGGIGSTSKLNLLSWGSIDWDDLIRQLFETDWLLSLNADSVEDVLEILTEKGGGVDLLQRFAQAAPILEGLLDLHASKSQILKRLLGIHPYLIHRLLERSEGAFVDDLLKANKKRASIILDAMEKQKIALTSRERVFKEVVFSENGVSLKKLRALSHEDREIAFRLANTYSRLKVVRALRHLGFTRKDPLLMREEPSIFGHNMDALEIHDRLRAFFREKRSLGLVLSRSEFNRLPQENYVKKTPDLGRILGRDYLQRTIRELGLQYIKVPQKIMVIEDHADLKLQTSASIYCKKQGVQVYAERIPQSSRKTRPEEAAELLHLCEVTGYGDIHTGNIWIAEDGIYIIDTEFVNFTSFSGCPFKKITEKVGLHLPKELCPEKKDEKISPPSQARWDLLNAQFAASLKTGCFVGPYNTFHHERRFTSKLDRGYLPRRDGVVYGPSFTLHASDLLE